MINQNKIEKSKYRTLTFDCYGTLIDWENGVLGYLQPLLQSYYINTIDEFVLEAYAQLAREAEAGGGSYRDVLGHVMQGLATRLGFTLNDDVADGLADSVQYWQPFVDAVPALHTLAGHFQLGVVTNMDDDLFEASRALLHTKIDFVVTARQAGAFKPAPQIFEAAVQQAEGPVLHVAVNPARDILPAASLGLDTVWINRPSVGGAEAAPSQTTDKAAAAVEPTWTFNSLEAFAAAITT